MMIFFPKHNFDYRSEIVYVSATANVKHNTSTKTTYTKHYINNRNNEQQPQPQQKVRMMYTLFWICLWAIRMYTLFTAVQWFFSQTPSSFFSFASFQSFFRSKIVFFFSISLSYFMFCRILLLVCIYTHIQSIVGCRMFIIQVFVVAVFFSC